MTGDGGTAGRGGKRRDAQRLTPAAVRVLETASELFYARGIRAIGVEAIAEEAGVTKKTLYDRFGSKDELIVAYLRARDALWRGTLVRYVEEQVRTPQEKLLATFDALRDWLRERNPRGCAFVNAHVELPADHPGQRVARDQKTWLLGYLRDLAAEAGAAEPEQLAGQLLILHEGASISHSLQAIPRAAERAREMAAVLVAQSLAPARVTAGTR
ncbi:TetR/AcrR family transcriptional regulator [Streptomyces sp. RS10V-4]|uniref:TetR/AcrR family transcriptional regulator n=1 Tax=Streptomyces rhizoryzae TaxID=2932493 RepID=UPI0020037624|nr:TetR/AcrR family transcriptional regulator [Streptomyces rhizoryzae]MCK7624299.1 TetR/AcrR family transcriptional regulator [Streptomyces rhizoryzae]